MCESGICNGNCCDEVGDLNSQRDCCCHNHLACDGGCMSDLDVTDADLFFGMLREVFPGDIRLRAFDIEDQIGGLPEELTRMTGVVPTDRWGF